MSRPRLEGLEGHNRRHRATQRNPHRQPRFFAPLLRPHPGTQRLACAVVQGWTHAIAAGSEFVCHFSFRFAGLVWLAGFACEWLAGNTREKKIISTMERRRERVKGKMGRYQVGISPRLVLDWVGLGVWSRYFGARLVSRYLRFTDRVHAHEVPISCGAHPRDT
ncbi:hypothetical protein GGI43DRAFT_396517 [Trichoderma evansii]